MPKSAGSLGSREGAGEKGGRFKREQELPFQQGRVLIWFSHSAKLCPKLVLCRRNHCSCTSVYFQEGEASRAVEMCRACFLSHSATPVSSWSFQFDSSPEFHIQHVQCTYISSPVKPTKRNCILNCERIEI